MPLPEPRILVLSAAVGAGHLRAAQAVEVALRQMVPEATVVSRDVLEFSTSAFRQLYGKSYLDLVNRAPHLLGYVYDLMDQPGRRGRQHADKMRLAFERMNLAPFLRFLLEESWDLAINTHFLPAEIIASLRRQEKLALRQVTICTDFDTHRLWVNQPCEHYFTATEEGARYLHHWGVPREDIAATGIPIHPSFSVSKDRAACLAKHGLADDRPIVLQMAGGFGVGPIEKLYRALLDVEVPIQVVAVTGRNQKVRDQLERVPCPPQHRTRLLGFTEHVDELMAVADLVVSKPGGLTTSEALSQGAAMVIVNPTPGQETRNSDFLLENGAAIKVNALATLAYKVTALLRDPQRLAQLKANAHSLGRPRADELQGALDDVERRPRAT
jgi:processive 1,2-diacylglycerol beta-glucosyltransferase